MLYALADDRGVLGRVLVLDQGEIAFALGGELLMFRDTGLGPCGGGNVVAYR